MEVLLPKSSTLACHKFASNVMETCLKHCPTSQKDILIGELLHPSNPEAPTVSSIARDQYGNYVLQRALEVASSEQKDALVAELLPHIDSLRRSGYGKHIAARVGKMGLAKQRQVQNAGANARVEQTAAASGAEKTAPAGGVVDEDAVASSDGRD